MSDYSFQKPIIEKTYNLMMDEGGVVLAAACGSGKTNMAIDIIDRFMATKPKATVLVLAHGQQIIRKQFAERSEQLKHGFKFIEIDGTASKLYKGMVHIAIPHAFKGRLAPSGKIDLLVVDEAHHFYHARMVQKIIDTYKPRYELLLTGTPSVFVRKKTFPIVSLSSIELLDFGVIADPVIELAECAYDFTQQDYNEKTLEVDKKYKFTKKLTDASLDGLAKGLANKLSTSRVNDSIETKWKGITSKLEKTIVACRSVKQAKDVSAYFGAIGINNILSTYVTDEKSRRIRRFIEDDSIKVMVVVNRGILGFNYENLSNVIDLSGSLNPDRVFQLLSRVVRKSKKYPLKLFLKVSPKELMPLTYTMLSFTVALSEKSIYETYDGLFINTQAPVDPKFKKQLDEIEKDPKRNKKRKLPKLDLPRIFTFNDLKNFRDKPLSEVAYTTFSIVKNKLYNQNLWENPRGWWTLDRCIDIANKCNFSIVDIKKNYSGAYNAINKNNWYNLCGLSSKYKIIKWTKERCIADAKKYSTRHQWQKTKGSSYRYALDKPWRHECVSHMPNVDLKITPYDLNELREEALKYSSTTEWNKASRKTYRAALKRGRKFFNEITSHMKKYTYRRWDEASVREEAKKFKSRSEWYNLSQGSYEYADRHGLLDELLPKKSPIRKWTEEEIKKEALKYSKRSEWKKKSPGSFDRAKDLGLIEKLIPHTYGAVE